jgi:small subunit ribosomal protein S20
MPTSPSAKKRLRQNFKRRDHNRAVKSTLRKQCRKVREAAEAGDVETAESALRVACKQLDRAGAKSIIHRNAAARTKSRLSARVKAAKQG